MEEKQAKSSRAPGSEPIAALIVWREAYSIIRRYPLMIVPALVLGASAEALALIGDSVSIDETSTNLAMVFAYYLYVAYAEEVVQSVRGVDNTSSPGRLLRRWQVVPIALRMLVASIAIVGIAIAAIVIVGLSAAAATEIGVADVIIGLLFLLLLLFLGPWVLTRLSLFAPALSNERLGPLAALKRSNELARGHFWLVFWTATLALLLEGLADEPVALAAELGFGSWGEWLGGSIVTALVMPLAAVTTSLAYHRVLEHKRGLSSEAHLGEEHVGGEDIPQRFQPIIGGADLITEHTSGLSADEVVARKARGEVNAPPPSPGRTYHQIVVENVFSFVNNVFYVLCLLLVLLGRPFDAILPMAVVLANVAVSVFQEVRAKRKLDEIALLTRSTAKVIRGGQEQSIDPGEIVRGDLLVVGPGDQIVVDGTVVGDGTMEVDESQLTGESDLVRKRAGDQVFSGSFCVTGSARFEARQIGAASFANRVTAGARAERCMLTPLQREINGMIRLMLLVAGFLMVVLTVSAVAYHTPFVELVQNLVVVIGLVPQGLLLAIVVAYALGAVRVAGQGALVQQTNAIQSLSNVDTFCLDKTGTLTTNRLQLHDVHPFGISRDNLQRWLSDFVASATTSNKTSEAIAQALPGHKQPAIDEVPFSSARKWSALVFDGQEEGSHDNPTVATDGTIPYLSSPTPHSLRGVYVLGAPEMLRPHLQQGADLNGQVDKWAADGLRVLLFACQPEPILLHDGADQIRDPQGLIPLGLVGLTDELRPKAYETLTAFAQEGVDLKIISGDNPETVNSLAVQAGFDPQAKLISGPELDRLDESQIAPAAAEYGVFGRITPQQKERLVQALHGQGRYVTMTGDGVNDVLSLKQADLGIAMQSGSQATRGVADIVLTNDSFAVLPQAITEGQRIIAGMQNVLKLFLSRTFFVALLIIAIGIVIDFPFPPRQSALLSFLTAGVPAVALAAWARPVRAARGSALGKIASFAVPAGFAVTLIGLLLFVGYSLPVFGLFAGGSPTVEEVNAALTATLPRAQTVLTYFLAMCGLLLVIIEPPSRFWAGGDEPSGDRRPTWLAIVLLVGVLLIAFVPGLSELFDLRPIAPLDIAVVGLAPVVWMFLVRWAWNHRLLERFLGTRSAL